MGEKIKNYCKKQIEDIKTQPKSIIKKWWFWILVIAIVYGISTESTNTNEINSVSTNNIVENSTNTEQTEENQVIIDEEAEAQKQKEQEEKERQQNIEDTKWSLYATTEQVIKNRLKSPSTAKFSNQQAVYDEETQTYKIQGDVDAQNSFGATVRSTFYAEYNNQLEVIYMTFDNEILVNKK